ncbi:HWE histidine kinase domain-containing protein [Aureimonas sp. ME7]|uniref:sensor histidine kinase n=1 Tax=Aureimonas sp. ME7 TaxID=2744252 RepID=UPI0015F5CDDE|nr:HWE histidine kinase domain-containing protein [Aureimonas sp. ME7]
MFVFEAAERVRASRFLGWGLAVLAFLVALFIRFVFDHALPVGFPYLTFFPAVILTAFFAGSWPGAACALASGLAAWYWFIPPFGAFSMDGSVVVALLFYVCIVTVDILLIELMHRAMDGLKAERAISRGLLERQRVILDEAQEREKRQRVLQRELAHRMKNTLAMVQAVVGQSLRHARSLEEASDVASARILALGRSQDMLTENNWQAADIRDVAQGTLQPHEDGMRRIALSGPAMDLNAMQSMGLSLTLHELATNALKYGALSVDGGRVAIDWTRRENGAFELVWRESGGPAVEPPTRRGFGSRLVERVVPGYFKGAARIEYRAGGVVFTLDGVLDTAGHEGATPAH